jgi:hypothetical protein
MLVLLKYLWALPNTLLGALFMPVALLSGGKVRFIDGVFEVHGRAISWLLRTAVPLRGGASALTLGHVVLGKNEALLARCRDHERVHVRQYEQWGPLFLPAYLVAGLLAFVRGRNAYLDNFFERRAREETGEEGSGRLQ